MKFSILQRDLDYILQNVDFKKFSKKDIFLTGATGFFGKWILEALCYANAVYHLDSKIWVLSRNSKKFKQEFPYLADNNAITFVDGDVRDFDFPKQKIDFIVHGATEASTKLNLERPELMLDTILEGTKRVLEFAEISNTSRFLFISSGAVYGKRYRSEGNIKESDTSAPSTSDPSAAYGEGKRLAEVLCNIYSRKNLASVSIARCFAFYGPHLPLDGHFAFGNFLQNLISGENIEIKGDGSPLRSYMYAADLAIWLFQILLESKNGSVYNVGSDIPISIGDLANKMANYSEKKISVNVAKPMAPGIDPELYVPSIDLIKDELALNEYINLEDGIQRTIEWQKLKN